MATNDLILQESLIASGARGGDSFKSFKKAAWGARTGVEDDKEDLKEIITAELIHPGNNGKFVCFQHF